MQPCPNPRLRVVVTHLEDAARGFGPCPNTPPDNERARQRGISEIDRQGVIQHPARPRWRKGSPFMTGRVDDKVTLHCGEGGALTREECDG
jgi:hypothetical protein